MRPSATWRRRPLAVILYSAALYGTLYAVGMFGTMAVFSALGADGPPDAFWDAVVVWCTYIAPQIYAPPVAARLANLFVRPPDRRPFFWTGIALLGAAIVIVGIVGIALRGWSGVLLLVVQLATAALGMRLLAWACGPMEPRPDRASRP